MDQQAQVWAICVGGCGFKFAANSHHLTRLSPCFLPQLSRRPCPVSPPHAPGRKHGTETWLVIVVGYSLTLRMRLSEMRVYCYKGTKFVIKLHHSSSVFLLSYCQLHSKTNVVLVQCVSPWNYCQPTSTCLNPVWCWSSVCPHRAIVNLLQPASTQCDVGPVCVPIELLSTYSNQGLNKVFY